MAYVIYEFRESKYNEAMDMAHDIKELACKLTKCLKEAEEREEEDEDDYEEYYEGDPMYRGRIRYRQDGGDNVPSQGMMGNEMDNSTSMRRGGGRSTRMRRERRPVPRGRYDW